MLGAGVCTKYILSRNSTNRGTWLKRNCTRNILIEKKWIPPLSRKLVFFANRNTQKNMQLLDKIHTVFTAALTRKINISLSPFAPENLVSRDGFGSLVPRQPDHLHTQAESGAYLRDSSRVRGGIHLLILKPPYAIGWSVPILSGHPIAYRWHSLPRVRRHRASKPQGSSKRVLPWAGHHGPINMRLSFPHPLLV